MSIGVCKNCAMYVDTDFAPMTEDEWCDSCDDERTEAEKAHYLALYEGERRAGLLRPKHEIDADLRDAGRGHLIRK